MIAAAVATWGTVALAFACVGTAGTALVLDRRRTRYHGRHRVTF